MHIKISRGSFYLTIAGISHKANDFPGTDLLSDLVFFHIIGQVCIVIIDTGFTAYAKPPSALGQPADLF